MAPGVPRGQSAFVTSSGSSSRFSVDPPAAYAKPSTNRSFDFDYDSVTFPMTAPMSPKRAVFLSDRQLADMAVDTDASVRWNEILMRHIDASSGRHARWKRIDDAGGFATYSKKEGHKFAVLAVGVIPCSVPEVTRLLHSPDADKYLSIIEGLYGDEFQDGAFVHRVPLGRPGEHDELLDLSVKSAVFHKSGWGHPREKWAFLEAAYRRDGGAAFEKLTTTLSPRDVTMFHGRCESRSSSGRGKFVHDVTTAFSVQPNEPESEAEQQLSRPYKETRVYFYGAFTPPSRHGFSMPTLPSPSASTIKQRLVTMARSCDRLTALVRRRRLGVQVLVDRRAVAMILSSPSMRCICCNKTIKLLGIKQCRICGHGVCTECSHKHERETKVRGSHRMMLEAVRVCDRCLDRVDRSDYSELQDTSLMGPVVHPNDPHAPAASTVLKDLLKDQLLQAASPSRKASVINVIKYVLNHEDDETAMLSPATSVASTTSSGRGGAVLFQSGKLDIVEALDELRIEHVPFDAAELATTHGRAYVVDPSNPDKQMTCPIPTNERERLEAMDKLHVRELINNSEELSIICDLAAKEMGTFGGMVTIVTPDEMQVVASSVDALQNATFPRDDAFCAHTMMDGRPILIPHPEADVRFNQAGPVKNLGIRYYCGFPIKNDADTVIGALCCIHKATRNMDETQFNAMTKLAQTASKVIQVQGRRRTMSNASK